MKQGADAPRSPFGTLAASPTTAVCCRASLRPGSRGAAAVSTRSNRRQFLQTSAAAAAAGAWWFNTEQAVALNFVQPNDRPRVGCIGTGDRWNDVGNRTMEFGDVLAVCDVDKAHVEKAQKRVKEKQNREVEGYEDYRKLLERND